MHSLRDRVRAAASDEEAWSVFSRGPEQTLNHAMALAEAFEQRVGAYPALEAQLGAIVSELKQVTADLRSAV